MQRVVHHCSVGYVIVIYTQRYFIIYILILLVVDFSWLMFGATDSIIMIKCMKNSINE